jgi:hypothetical protein
MTTTKTARTPEQKAAHAAAEKARRQARKQAENRPAEIEQERDAADDFIAAAIAANPTGVNDVHDVIAHQFDQDAMPTEAEVEASAKPVDLSTMDTITLYRTAQAEVATRRTNPDVATPHLDELTSRKGGKVVAGKMVAAPRKTTSERAPRHPLFDQAETERKRLANHRGKGTKITADEMVEVARRLHAGGLVERQANEVAYWVEKLAVSRGTWAKAWTAATTTAQEGAAI